MAALVGPNGAGKADLLRLLAREIKPHAGTVTISGATGVMPQFVGSVRDERTVRDLLVSVAPPAVRQAARAVDTAELAIMERDDEAAQMGYAQALSDWAEARGYEAETLWDMCTTAALGVPLREGAVARSAHPQRGRAEAAGAGGVAAGHRRCAAAGRAGQLPGCAGQAVAGGAAARDDQDRTVRPPRPRTVVPGGRADRQRRAGPGRRRMGSRRRFRHLPRGPGRAVRTVRGTAPALGRETCPTEAARAGHAAVRGAQR